MSDLILEFDKGFTWRNQFVYVGVFPDAKIGIFSVFGLVGISSIDLRSGIARHLITIM
jgi:hypothetical protein